MTLPLFVIDASVAVAWAFETEENAYIDAVLNALEIGPALAPGIWPLEVANALWVSLRRGRLRSEKMEAFLDELSQLPITVMPVQKATAWQEILPLARETGLSVYDASYLHLALQRGVPLATQDRRLRQAAQARGLWFDPTSSPA